MRRIARQSLADALAQLGQGPLADRSVHLVRKDLKRARAMLRLMRTGLGEADYRDANHALRDAGRELGAVRDSKVALDTLKHLSRHGATGDLDACLRREHRRSRHRLRTDGAGTERACKALRRIRRRLGVGPAERYGWPVVLMGLRRVYARARLALAHVRKAPTAENLHELRKQTKYLWHQLETFSATHAADGAALAAATHRLSDLLGEDHDLTTLRTKTLHAPMQPGARRWVLGRVDTRRERLLGKALQLAESIYQEPPAVFAARIGRAARAR